MPAIVPISIAQLRETPEAKAAKAPDAQFQQALEGAKTAAPAGNLVPVVRTQLSAGQAQEALRTAWQKVTGEAPSDKTLALITAQWAHETGGGASMYNYNFAGIKGAGPDGLSVAQHTREGYGASERQIVDNFRAYKSAEDGATDYVQLLSKRFPEAVEGARQGDPSAFVRGLKSRGYFTGQESAYATSVASIASRYLGEPLTVSSATPPTLDYQGIPGASGPIDLQGLYAQMAPSPDSVVDAMSITNQINRAALKAFSGAPRGFMNARLDAAFRYLDVRYSERERPYTDYPSKLTAHLTEEYLRAYRGASLLDLGCGRGEFLHGFADLGFDATGFDRSRPAEPRFSEPVVVGDYEQGGLPFADGQFSVLFNKSVFEHVRDISPLLRECHRVLAPGGRMVSLVPDWMAQWRHFYDDWTHVRPFTLIGLRECIQSHGFEVREAVRFRQLPLLWQHPYLNPLSDAAALLPSAFKRSKFVRFSKEWMLLVVADRVG